MRHLHHSSKATLAMLLVCGTLYQGRMARAACSAQAPDPSNDLSLECLIGARAKTDSYDPTLREQSLYRSLISELSAVLAVPMLDPADTVGYSGFHFSADTTITTVSKDAEYFSGTLNPKNGAQQNAPVRNVTGGILPVISLTLRKGVWTPVPPLPSVEVGFGASNLVNSGIYGLNGYFKLAVHEGYHDVWVPSIALRASVSRIAGSPEVDLTIINADALISKAFGAGGTLTFEPFLGGGVLFSIFRSQVIDTNPSLDLYRGPPGQVFGPNDRVLALNQKISFPTQDNIFRYRLFAGLHLHYAILALTASFAYYGAGADNGFDLSTLPTGALPGDANRAPACRIASGTTVCPKDLAAGQYQVAFSAGLRF